MILRIGIVGLSIGTLAAYGRRQDYFRFYEINPDVIRIAHDERYFTYLKDRPARRDVLIADARISMEQDLWAGLFPWPWSNGSQEYSPLLLLY